MRILSLIAAVVVGVPLAARAQTPATFLGYKTTVPAGWTSRAPSSSMRLAEYATDGADVVVYFFGKGQGGNVEANLERWKAQFSTSDGSPVPELVTRDSTGAFPITFAEYRGTYARGVGAGDPAQVKPGQMLLAAVAETPEGTLFIQMFGPVAGVSAHGDELRKFVRTLAAR